MTFVRYYIDRVTNRLGAQSGLRWIEHYEPPAPMDRASESL